MSRRMAKAALWSGVFASVFLLAVLFGCAQDPAPSAPPRPALTLPEEDGKNDLPPDAASMLDETEPAELDPDHSAREWEIRVLAQRVEELERRNEQLGQQLEDAEHLYRDAQRRVDELEQTRQEKVERDEERIQELEDRQRELQEQRKTTQHLNYRLGGMSKELQDLRNQFAAMQLERRAEAARYEQTIRELREKLEQRGIE